MTAGQIFVLAVSFILMAVAFQFDKRNNTAINGTKSELIKSALENSFLYTDEIATIIVDCVKASSQNCELVYPADLTKHLAPYGTGVEVTQSGEVIFTYIFEREKVSSGGGRLEYSTQPVEKMVQKLNQVLPNYFRKSGFTPRLIVDKKEGDNGTVYFSLVAFDNLNEAKYYLGNLGVII